MPFGKRETCIIGGIRLNDSVINGVFEIVGSRITAAPSGAAVDAIGATIKSDLLFASVHPDRRSTDEVHEGCQIPVAATPPAACSNKDAVIYAIDQTLPLIHVTSGNGCEIPHTAPKTYYSWHILMLFLSWIVIPTAGLTFSGILRETTK